MKLTESYLRKIVKEELTKVLEEEQQIGELSDVELGVLEALSYQQEYASGSYEYTASASAIKKLYDAMVARSNGMLQPVLNKDFKTILVSLIQKGFIGTGEGEQKGRFYTTEAGDDILENNANHPIINLISNKAQ